MKKIVLVVALIIIAVIACSCANRNSIPMSQMTSQQLKDRADYWQLRSEKQNLSWAATADATEATMYQNELLRRLLIGN
jgi:hypothetical protein